MTDHAPRSRNLADWVRPAQQGERDAMRALLEGLAPLVLSTARRVVGNSEDARDAAQDAMHAVVRDLGSLREPAAIIAFAKRVAARVSLRHRQRCARAANKLTAARSALGAPPEPPTVDELQHERAQMLRDHLESLPPPQAEALVMQYMLGYQPAEIAAVANVSVNTIRSRVRLGKAALSRALQADPRLDQPHALEVER